MQAFSVIEKIQDVKNEEINSYPNNLVGVIESIYKNGSKTVGTGFLIGKTAVLTAMHNIYSKDRKQIAAEVYYKMPINAIGG